MQFYKIVLVVACIVVAASLFFITQDPLTHAWFSKRIVDANMGDVMVLIFAGITVNNILK